MKSPKITPLQTAHILMGKQTAIILPAHPQQVVCPYGQIHNRLWLHGTVNIRVEITDILHDNIDQMDIDQLEQLCLPLKSQEWTPVGVDSDGTQIKKLALFASLKASLAAYWFNTYHVDIARQKVSVWLISFRKV